MEGPRIAVSRRRQPEDSPRRTGRGGLVVALLMVATMGLTGCGRSLAADRSVHITAPAALSTVKAPFTTSWTPSDKHGSRYAVFVDHLPVPPGHTLRDVALD